MRGEKMSEMPGIDTNEYRQMNAADRKTVRRCLIASAAVQLLAIFALIAVASLTSQGDAGSVTAEKPAMSVHAEAR
jgi:hypothetical protein